MPASAAVWMPIVGRLRRNPRTMAPLKSSSHWKRIRVPALLMRDGGRRQRRAGASRIGIRLPFGIESQTVSSLGKALAHHRVPFRASRLVGGTLLLVQFLSLADPSVDLVLVLQVIRNRPVDVCE